jgi:hypothetical protein
MNNGAMPDERGTVLKFGPDIRDVEGTVDFQDDVCAVRNLNSDVVVAAADVSRAAGVAVTGCHCHCALGVC